LYLKLAKFLEVLWGNGYNLFLSHYVEKAVTTLVLTSQLLSALVRNAVSLKIYFSQFKQAWLVCPQQELEGIGGK
jgi:hypothetical protein